MYLCTNITANITNVDDYYTINYNMKLKEYFFNTS